MPVLFKYIIRELLKSVALILLVVAVIYLAVDFLAKIDKFVEAGVTGASMAAFFALKMPLIVFQITPIAVLLAALVVFGLMHRNNEVVALKSSGINPRKLLRPVVIAGIGFCVFVFFLSEWVIPLTSSQANLIWLKDVRKKDAMTVKRNDIWIKDKSVVAHIKRYNPDKQIAYDLTINYFDKQFRLTRRIDAKTAHYTDRQWVLSHLVDLRFGQDGQPVQSELKDHRVVFLDILPQDLGKAAKRPEEMGLVDLYQLIRRVAEEGYDTTAYRVSFHDKLAFPLVCLLMILIGAGIGLSDRGWGGMSANIAYGLGASFLYYVVYSFCLSLGHGGMLPPVAAAWTANVVFAGVAAALVWKIE